jgi:hypothetical protein
VRSDSAEDLDASEILAAPVVRDELAAPETNTTTPTNLPNRKHRFHAEVSLAGLGWRESAAAS